MKIKRFNEAQSSYVKGNKIPTAVEFLHNFESDKTPDDDTIFNAMIGFAKLHVEIALCRAHSNMQLPPEDLGFTLQSYPLDNIK